MAEAAGAEFAAGIAGLGGAEAATGIAELAGAEFADGIAGFRGAEAATGFRVSYQAFAGGLPTSFAGI